MCREAARRTVRMRHFDVQLMGGMVLHQGKIAEMATGEGKTLVATLPAYLNALPGLGTHIVTVNDYLARRDAQWMGPIYHALGLTVGVIQHEMSYLFDPTYASPDIRLAALRPCSRREAYRADIIYGTNNEFGFDYLRDNMRFSLEEMVQREHTYAIVDEVDSILIDEARTPLIISGPAEGSTDKYYKIDRVIPKLSRAATIVEGKLSEIEAQAPGDYIVDEKSRAVSLTEQGIAHCERLLDGRQPLRPDPHGDRSTTSTRPSRPTPSSRRTWTTWSRTARSSSSTSSPGGSCRGGGGRTASTRRSRRRKASGSSRRIRRLRRSPSRTTSGCTTSWRA